MFDHMIASGHCSYRNASRITLDAMMFLHDQRATGADKLVDHTLAVLCMYIVHHKKLAESQQKFSNNQLEQGPHNRWVMDDVNIQ